tara:strand:- start:143 stop:856 length:714 start_codon:yes stop_codon:yes gene_type:complete
MKCNQLKWRVVLLLASSIIITACGGGSSDSTNSSIPESAVSYKVTFSSNWTSTSFPTNYPSNSHFSPLIGMTHNTSASLFQSGSQSSPGVEEVAETGSTNVIKSEIGDIQNLGNGQSLIEGGGLPNGQSQLELTFNIDEDFPLVSIITMVAPSPDWFVGVDSLNLYQNGTWVDQVQVDLKVYDSGTDSGVTFGSANSDSSPKMNIELLTSNISDTDFVDGIHRTTGAYIGTFTFKRQ